MILIHKISYVNYYSSLFPDKLSFKIRRMSNETKCQKKKGKKTPRSIHLLITPVIPQAKHNRSFSVIIHCYNCYATTKSMILHTLLKNFISHLTN